MVEEGVAPAGCCEEYWVVDGESPVAVRLSLCLMLEVASLRVPAPTVEGGTALERGVNCSVEDMIMVDGLLMDCVVDSNVLLVLLVFQFIYRRRGYDLSMTRICNSIFSLRQPEQMTYL